MKLIVIDPHVTPKSPSMRAWVEAFEENIRPLFDEIEIWASECDIPESAEVKWIRIPQRLPAWKLHALDFRMRVSRRFSSLPQDSNCIVQVTGCMITEADIHVIHFWQEALLEEASKRPKQLSLGRLERMLCQIHRKREQQTLQVINPNRYWWVVSRSLADRIKASGASGHFRVIPNQYNPKRFCQDVRNRLRDPMREKYGFDPGDKVYVFSAFGHFERKGLTQGIEAITELRKRGHPAKYLIIGGTPKTLRKYRKHLSAEQEAACVFTGLVENIEQHLVAADALLFPSHFEAFSLAEIEAAALGLRLYLTRHYGSEMILREPKNGRWLPWSPKEMADVLEEDLENGSFGQPHDELGEALDNVSYAKRLQELYREAIANKASIT